MGRNFLAFAQGDANNAVLAAVGCNFSLLLNWLGLLCAFITAMLATTATPPPPAAISLTPQITWHNRLQRHPSHDQCLEVAFFTDDK
ncbi:hypothetical protein FJ970_33280 (plasmid) [Mesorhizobium sp. B2-1-8]|uniref:hypothetical protein n=1 Tax=Mesorhizobium sp. B2-1-8 TaxID=2589967 RepID=UPI0015E2CDA5|nr:hypothetical protein [Mesorhizobium sp. B2-1-8]UCI23065.1 hypothetical protein FJ970_33280 [Mesorhizobium sp. B2-1-8]